MMINTAAAAAKKLILSDILFYFSDFVITIYVITSRAIIATPSGVASDFNRPADIQRTNAGHIYGHRTQPGRRTVPSCEHHIRHVDLGLVLGRVIKVDWAV